MAHQRFCFAHRGRAALDVYGGPAARLVYHSLRDGFPFGLREGKAFSVGAVGIQAGNAAIHQAARERANAR